ncbi:MAG: FkbM family methyltransferase, partial [Porcipelethomonas sp.]
MSVFRKYGIKTKGIFASDDFVRGHYFEGFKVLKLSEVEEIEDEFAVVLAFAAGYEELVNRIKDISKKHTLYVPDVPVIGTGLFTYDYCVEHADELEQVYNMLADDLSKEVFASIINFKISGDIKHLENITSTKAEIYKDIIKPNLNEHYVDLGAYNGDTIKELLELTKNKYVRIYAVEPDRKNFRKLTKYIDNKEHIYAYNNAAWCVDTQLPFSSKAGRQSSLATQGTKFIESRSVDSILEGREATLIKMDVEGAEREALWGNCQTISRYSPRLMVALYHRNEDIFELPLLVNKLNPKYKLYIRHQLYIPAWETNLYAVTDN